MGNKKAFKKPKMEFIELWGTEVIAASPQNYDDNNDTPEIPIKT